jgi:serine/threonine protein kinase
MIAPQTIVGGRYRVVKVLGGGGMKVVYLAEDLRLAARRCALAEMVDSFTSPDAQQQAVAAFQREADMLAQLSNEHIPCVFDRFSEANHHFLVMEYIDGGTLEAELQQQGGKLTADRVIDIAIQVLETLVYLHNLEPPVVYRDLKPSNIMVTADGQAKLIDFGIARHFQPFTNATMIGTQGYAPPEQYRGKVETRSDLYALGATMHHAISGRDPAAEPPFSFPPLRKICPDVDSRLAGAVDQSLAYDVVNRIGSASDFRRRLLEIKLDAAGSSAVNVSAIAAASSSSAGVQSPSNVASGGSLLHTSQPSATQNPPSQPKSSHNAPTAPTLLSVTNDFRCPNCSRMIPADSRFCSYCASDLRLSGRFQAALPTDETVVLSGDHSPQAPRTPPIANYPPLNPSHTMPRQRSGFRRPVLMLALIFVAGFIVVKLIFLAMSENTAPSGYGGGDTPGAMAHAHAGAPSGNPDDFGDDGSMRRASLMNLRAELNEHGFSEVKFRMEGDTLVLSGTVPTEFDRATVQVICFATTGIASMRDDLTVRGDEPDD